jgi:hypothetical protein
MRAEFTKVSLAHGHTFADYLNMMGLPAEAYNSADLQSPGEVIYFTATLVGFKDRKCTVTGFVCDAQSQARVLDLSDSREFTPEAEKDSASAELWVPRPERAGSFFVRLEFRDPNGTRLTYLDSGVYDVGQ